MEPMTLAICLGIIIGTAFQGPKKPAPTEPKDQVAVVDQVKEK